MLWAVSLYSRLTQSRATEVEAGYRHYRVFDLCLKIDFTLPGIPEVDASTPDLVVHKNSGAKLDESDYHWFHHWKDAKGEIAISGGRRDGAYVLRFPQLADFLLQPALNEILIFPGTDIDQKSLSHLLLDQVIPRLLNQQGRLVIHASCVTLPNGQTVAFLGNTGLGKSTLASSFYQAGCCLIADDCLLLQFDGNDYSALPAYASLRLWPDSADELFPLGEKLTPMAGYSDKLQLMIPADTLQLPLRLAALFILSVPEDGHAQTGITLEAARGPGEIISLIESVFALDVEDKDTISRNFALAGAVLSSGLPVYRLVYPRQFDQLPAVRDAIMSMENRTVVRL